MKRKLFPLASILFLVLFAQNLVAQTQPAATNPQQVPAKAKPITQKKWSSAARQKPVAAGQTAVAPATARVDTVKNTDFSLNGQYQFLLSKSRSINGYKLVNPYRLTAVWKSVTDTLVKERAELIKLKAKVAAQEKTIGSLQTEVKGNETEVNNTNAKIDEINFLGLSFTKSTYNTIVWSIVGILAIALFVVIARSAKNITEAKHRTQLYEEVSAEYQAFKAKSVEKERKLARELQDERNKLDELNSKR